MCCKLWTSLAHCYHCCIAKLLFILILLCFYYYFVITFHTVTFLSLSGKLNKVITTKSWHYSNRNKARCICIALLLFLMINFFLFMYSQFYFKIRQFWWKKCINLMKDEAIFDKNFDERNKYFLSFIFPSSITLTCCALEAILLL